MPASDFDFLRGRWRVRHRKLARRLAASADWLEFEGDMTSRPLLGGGANIDENRLDDPTGPYEAVALRVHDPALALWSIWWIDGRFPELGLGVPVRGRFETGEGRFLAEDTHDGKPVRVRFLWTAIDGPSPRWEQAFSADGGATWEVNWTMDFTRLAG